MICMICINTSGSPQLFEIGLLQYSSCQDKANSCLPSRLTTFGMWWGRGRGCEGKLIKVVYVIWLAESDAKKSSIAINKNYFV